MTDINIATYKKKTITKKIKHSIKKNYPFWLLALIPICFIVIFNYIPIFGIQIAFKDFKITKGILGSEWIGFKNFELLFRSKSFWNALKNTLVLSCMRLVFSFPCPLILSLLLNEVRNLKFKKFVQTCSYMPHFVSWVIIAGLVTTMLSMDGPINGLIKMLGGEPVSFMTNPKNFKAIVIISNMWKEIGWGTLFYLAAIAGVNTELYEACVIDGGGRFQQALHVTLPCIKGVFVVQLIGMIGGILHNNFEQVFLLMNESVIDTAQTLEIYNYQIGLVQSNYSIGAATSLALGVCSFVLISLTNRVSRLISGESMW